MVTMLKTIRGGNVMAFIWFLALILPIILTSSAWAKDYDVKSEHPYLYFSSGDMDRIKKSGFSKPEYLGETSFTTTHYETKLTHELPPKQPPQMGPPKGFPGGVYPYWTSISRNLEIRLKDLSLSYLSTGDERYAKRAISYALALCEWDTWVEQPYNNSLSVSHLTTGVVTVYDLLYHEMTPQEREIIRGGILELGLSGLLSFAQRWSEDMQNGSVLIHSALGTASLALIGEVDEALEYLNRARDYAAWWLDEALDSGKTEGVLYNGYALDYLVRFLLALKNATGDDELLKHPYLTEHLTPWLIYLSSSDFATIGNFEDSSLGSWSSYAVPLTILNQDMDDAYAGWYLHRVGIGGRGATTFDGVAYGVGRVKNSKGPESWPISRAFPMGWVAMRTGWKDNDSVLLFKSSDTNLGHNHFDQNNFIFNANGQWLLVDQGYKDYNAADYTTGTEGHNSLLLDGQGQRKKGGGKIDKFVDSETMTYTVGDASGAYLNDVNWKRHIILVKEGGYYIFLDEAKSASMKALFFGHGEDEPKEFSFLLHPASDLRQITMDGKGRSGLFKRDLFKGVGSELCFSGYGASAIWKVLIPEEVRIEEVMPLAGKSAYFKIGPEGKVKEFTMVSLLQGKAGNLKKAFGVNVSDDIEDFIGIEVTRDDGRDIIIINRRGAKVNWAGVETDATLAVISMDKKASVVSSAIIGGQVLLYNGLVPSGLERYK
jgi:hypothetical protein